MITAITLGLSLCALQDGAPVSTALGRPVTREPNPVMLVQRGAAVRFEVPAVWTEQEKLELTELPAAPPFPSRRSAARALQLNTVTVTPADFQAALAGIPALETPVETRLPLDGRLMLVWNRATGVIDVQMAVSTVVVAEGEFLACPRAGELMIGMVTRSDPKTKAHLVNGKLNVTELSRAGDPTPRLRSYSAPIAATFAEMLENPMPAQIALGYFDLQATGVRVNNLPQYRCALSTWQEEPGQRDLCVAKSADELRWYIWFEGQMPE